MPATISGIVFNDQNNNGSYNASEPGIQNVYVVLLDTTGTCTQVQTNSTGNYSFTNINVAGTYTIYETVTTPNACPPTLFTQPSGARFYVVDVNSNRATYGRLINPAAGFTEQTTSPFGVAISAAINIADWSFNPRDNQLYGVDNSTGIAYRINPVTGVITALTTSPAVVAQYGATFFDNNNNLYAIDNNTGQIYRYAISGSTVTRTYYSTSLASGQNDGLRCATAPITFAYLTPASSLAPPGVEVGSIPVGTTTVTFAVKVDTIPSPNPMRNSANTIYTYQDEQGGSYYTDSVITNTVPTNVNYVLISASKYSTRSYNYC